MTEIPYLNENEIRGLFYIQDINHELDQDKPATISQLVDHSEWRSNYYTNLWKSLHPELINREKDGNNTRLNLTETGVKTVSTYKKLNQLFEEAGL